VENSEIERIIRVGKNLSKRRKLLKWEEKSMIECSFIEKIKSRVKKNNIINKVVKN